MGGYARAVGRALWVALAANVAVAAAKLWAGWNAGALSVLADGLNSAVDALVSVALLLLVRLASKPPDPDHPYGHERIETVGAFALSGVLFLTAYEVARNAVLRLVHGAPPPETTALLVAILTGNILLNLGVAAYERRRGEAIGSDMLVADAAHSRSDAWVGVGVLLGLAAVSAGYPWMDPVIALGVAGVIAYSGYDLVRMVLPVLTDQAPFDPREVKRVAEAVPGVEEAHDIRSRGRRREAFIQLHLIVEPEDVERAHAVTRAVEDALMREFGAREVFCHVEPEDHGRPDVGVAPT